MPPIEPNKKFVAQKEKEDRQKRLIMIATIAVLVIVVGLVGYGLLDRYVLQPNTAILKIENRKIDIEEFDQRVRYERYRLINQLVELINFTAQLGGTPDTFAYFEPQINQIVTELEQPMLVGQRVVEALTEELILLEEAEKMGIEINQEIIDQEMRKIFGYFPDGTPTPEPTRELIPTSTQSDLQKTLLPPTATPEQDPEQESTSGDQPTATAQQAEETNPDPTATPLLRPTEYTEDLFQENYQQAMENLEAEAGITEKTFRNLVKIFYLREEIIDVVTADVLRTQEQVRARHILVEEEDLAQELYERLEDGEDFAELAEEYSVDTVSAQDGGDLGWFGRGRMIGSFEEASFDLEVGEISQPVETDFGYHIIQSLGKDERPIDDETYQQLKNQAYQEWLQEKKNEYGSELNEEWTTYIPNEPQVPTEIMEYLQAQRLQLQQQPQQQQVLPTAAPESEGDE